VKFDKTGCNWVCVATCRTEDGREVMKTFDAGDQEAANLERMYGVLNSQLCKTVGIFKFSLNDIGSYNVLPFMSVAAVNHIRRTLAEELESMPCIKRDLLLRKIEKIAPVWDTAQKEISYKFNVSNRLSHSLYTEAGAGKIEDAYELSHSSGAELMRTKYCIRYELGMCPVHHKAPQTGPLFLLNNGQRFALHFDCKNCEMTVNEANTPQQQK
jgi:putative protease